MMRRIIIAGFILSSIIFMTFAAFAEERTVEINVSAAVSLKDALTEIQAVYQERHPNARITFNFGSSGALQTQIEQGAPCDLFISAGDKQMDALEKENLLVKGLRRNLVGNQLVLVVPKNSNGIVANFKDLAKENVKKIGIGAPESVPAGQYAVEVFRSLKLWEDIQNKLVYGTNVRAVLTYVESGNVDAGIVYKTDALISDQVKIVATASPNSHEPILYPAAILTGTKQLHSANQFLKFLASAKARRIFKKYGFVSP